MGEYGIAQDGFPDRRTEGHSAGQETQRSLRNAGAALAPGPPGAPALTGTPDTALPFRLFSTLPLHRSPARAPHKVTLLASGIFSRSSSGSGPAVGASGPRQPRLDRRPS